MKVEDRIILFRKKEGFEPKAFQICPRFESCNVNRCPLHPDFLKLQSAPEDKEQRCKIVKSIRHQIGLYFKLANEGLKERELTGKKRWESLSPEQQEAKKKSVRDALFIAKIKKEYNSALSQNQTLQPNQKAINAPTASQERLA